MAGDKTRSERYISLNGPWVCWVFARESEIVRESVCACVRERVSLSMCVFLCVSLCVSLSLTLSLYFIYDVTHT